MIRFAAIQEIDELMDFIDREWRKNHILAREKEFFEYMYVIDGKVNFAVSRENKTNKINGILGFIPYDKDYQQISLTVWKALSSADGMIGLALLNYIIQELQPVTIASLGINPKTTIPLYRYLKFEVGKMKHFYRISNCKSFLIADIKDIHIRQAAPNDNSNIYEITTFEEFEKLKIRFEKYALKKESWYIKRRYFEHPKYQYRFFFVEKHEEQLFIILREQSMGIAKCIRVVDLIGNYSLLKNAAYFIDFDMQSHGYEYIDCYITGVDKEIFLDAGWCDVEDTKDIIPNYFDPFERTNIDLFYSSKPDGVVILRGDSDQDRPN